MALADEIGRVLSDPSKLPPEFLEYMRQHIAQNPIDTYAQRAPVLIPTGTPGATAASRFVGATTTGAPATGTYVVGDIAHTHDGHIFTCTVAGSPGTWVEVATSSGRVGFKGARIQATSTQSVADSTNTNLAYQSVLFDTDSMANLGSDNRILTVNTAGLYLVVCQTVWAPNGAGRRINVAIRNALYTSGSIPDVDSQADSRPAIWNPVSSPGRTGNVSVGLYQASAGDFFSSGAFQASGAALNANGFANCFLSAVLIGVS